MERAALVMQTVKRVLDASGLGAVDRIRVMLSAAAVEHRAFSQSEELPPFGEMARDVEELAVLAENPAATLDKGEA